jgi:hypothetical protein
MITVLKQFDKIVELIMPSSLEDFLHKIWMFSKEYFGTDLLLFMCIYLHV